MRSKTILGKRQRSKSSSFFWASKTEILAQTLHVNQVKTTILINNLDFCNGNFPKGVKVAYY